MRCLSRLAILIITLLITACSGEHVYSIGQEWQRHECMKIEDAEQRSQCLADARVPYEDYRRQQQVDTIK